MSQPPATRRPRPLSPHLTVYRWPVTMTASILNRITGGALYFGTLLIVWWLVAAATSEPAFSLADRVMTSWFGLLVLLGFTWALVYHLLSGVRHMIWDMGRGLEKHAASQLSWASLVGSAVLTLVVWVVYSVTGA